MMFIRDLVRNDQIMKKKWVKPVVRPMIAGSADNLAVAQNNEPASGGGGSRRS